MVEEKCEIFEGFFFSILKNIHFAVDPNERGEFSWGCNLMMSWNLFLKVNWNFFLVKTQTAILINKQNNVTEKFSWILTKTKHAINKVA